MCYRCDLLDELFKRTPLTNRDYWVMTELFVFLHEGKDYCDYRGSVTKTIYTVNTEEGINN